MITRDQFIRGFNAIQAAHARRDVVNTVARGAGYEEFDIGDDPVVYELRRQIEERCGDRVDEDGQPFAHDEGIGDIEYALYEKGEVTPFEGADPYPMNDAESVWRFWMHSKTGPFRPSGLLGSLPRYDIRATEDEPEPYAHADASGDFVKFADIESALTAEAVEL